ncbi:MAG: TIGR00341 family protein [Planctomycetes bacterium]|nr:TIGR00341 family protein [Planctomycetota bacterium]
MALRMIELILPRDYAEKLKESFDASDFEVHGIWTEELDEGKKLVRVLASAGGTEAVLDEFEKRFNWLKDYRVVLIPAEATLPRPEEPRKTDKPKRDVGRINREELYADVLETARLSRVFMVMVALSTVVAGVGLVRDSSVIVLSAMVIAPLLGPNVALALATTLGDRKLARTALRSSTAGFGLAIGLAVIYGLIFRVHAGTDEIASRTHVGFGDIALALAAGTAGALSLTAGASGTLIGVMVAVALLPPTIVTGMLIGSGHFAAATGAAELVAINLVCLILAAIVTFLVQGIRPTSWWEAEAAKKATRRALIAGGVLLALLAGLILLQVG